MQEQWEGMGVKYTEEDRDKSWGEHKCSLNSSNLEVKEEVSRGES